MTRNASPTNPTPRILVVDDEPSMRRLLSYQLARAGYQVATAETGEEALEAIAGAVPDMMLLDLMLPGIDGLEVLRRARQRHPDLPVVVITAHGSIDTAVEAMKLGASDFLGKPFELERLAIAVRNALSIGRLSRQVQHLENELRTRYRFAEIVGADGGLAPTVRMIEKVIPTDLTVLLLGESGTGKELFARAIHHEGPRGRGPFIAINCAALPESLRESELFGHEKGAFTGAISARPGKFELAHGGTLFLDEVAELSRPVQAKLLRAVQEHAIGRVGGTDTIPIDVRIICATNVDLAAEVRAGRFREDLFYRLSVFPITIPPLRERREDIAVLAKHVLAEGRSGQAQPVNPAAMSMLEAYTWPGNVRELQNVLRRARVLAGDGPVRPEHLPANVQAAFGDTLSVFPGEPPLRLSTRPPAHDESKVPTLEEVERAHILRAVESCRGNLSLAARVLDIGRTTLYRKLQRYGVHVEA